MNYEAKDILAMKEPGELFSGSPDTLKREYKELAKSWHPDNLGNSKEASDVMANINKLHVLALEMINSGSWVGPNLIMVTDLNKKGHTIRFKVSRSFELGTMYIGNNLIAYSVLPEHRELYNNAIKVISSYFKYRDDTMKEEFSRCLPSILDSFETKNSLYLVIKKTPDVYSLRDILNYFKGQMEGCHVAWIINRLYNILCYVDYIGFSHNSVSLDTFFISPEFHSGLLLGGWWYAVPQGSKLLSVPGSTYELLPPVVKATKCGNIATDLELIRSLGRELLGDRAGTKLIGLNEANLEPVINWLRGVASSSNKVANDYTQWEEVLQGVFGPRKFVPLVVENLY